MKISKMNVSILVPDNEGNWLTDGINFGKKIYIGVNDSVDNWSEISNEQKFEIEKELAKIKTK